MSDERRYQPLKFGSLTIADDAGVIRTFIEGNNERIVQCVQCGVDLLASDDIDREEGFVLHGASGLYHCFACWEIHGCHC